MPILLQFPASFTFIAIYHTNTANTVAPQTLPTMYESVSSSSQLSVQSVLVVGSVIWVVELMVTNCSVGPKIIFKMFY